MDESKKITVEQKRSQGYRFENFEYDLRENDGDSLFVIKDTGYKFDIPSPQEFSFSPYNGIEINRKTYFKSNEEDAFVWLKNDSVMVKVPYSINSAKVSTTGKKEVYTNLTTKSAHGFEQTETVTIPSGQSEFHTQIQFHRRTVSYKLYLINKRIGKEKVIEGKWVEIAPTGKYEVEWKY